MQKPQMTSEKVHHRMDLLLALIELSVVFSVAGWVTYYQWQKEKGAPAGSGAGAETEDEEGATPAQNDVEGSDGQ